MKIRVGIVGGAGYTGGELIRILLHHPNVEIATVFSRSQGDQSVTDIHHDLFGDTDIRFTNDLSLLDSKHVDLIFLCSGHGESKKFLTENSISNEIRVIDLSNDFRLKADSNFNGREFVYGLPELQREKIKTAKNIANPGCFATAIQLGLLPLAKAGLLEEVFTTGITGSTGAGQSLSQTSHFSWRSNNIQAYKTLTHQHLGEINQSLESLLPESGQHNATDRINFVPWRGDFTRGIFVSSTLSCDRKEEQVGELFLDFYKEHPFTFLSQKEIYLKQVLNTNKCVIQLQKVGSKLVVHSALDNLLKGASGQAVQNMNLMFGLDETTGLHLKSIGF